jgi:large subunit ribosomal protein L31e
MVRATKQTLLKEDVTREYTIHLHKYIHSVVFKKRAPRAIAAIKAFARRTMGTEDVRIDAKVNKEVWKNGIRGVPNRVRVRLSRRRADTDASKPKLYTYVTLVPVTSFRGLQTVNVDE